MALAPSLFRPAPAAVLSELYLTNGANQFSLVDGDDQLIWVSRFAPPQPEYYQARYEGLGGNPEPPLTEPASPRCCTIASCSRLSCPWSSSWSISPIA